MPAVDSRKRKSVDGVATGSSKRNKNGSYVSYPELQRLKALANAGTTAPQSTDALHAPAHDPWATEPAPVEPQFSFLEKKKPTREPTTLKHPAISLAKSGKPFAAVKKPEGGKSYNPAFEDWEALVTREGQKEVEAEKNRLQEAQADAERLEKALTEAAKPEPKEDDDDYESAWESEWDGIQSEAEDSYLNKKRPERKSQVERNKLKKRKEAEAKAKWEKEMKKRQDQENRIKEIARSIAKKERARLSQPATADDDDSDEEEVLRRRNLGKNPYVASPLSTVLEGICFPAMPMTLPLTLSRIPQADLELVLADELQDSLRALRPEGNLLKDRFRNLMLNGKIEARKSGTQWKKPKREVTEKWSYKDWKLQ